MIVRHLDSWEILPCGPDANIRYLDELLHVAQKGEREQGPCPNHVTMCSDFFFSPGNSLTKAQEQLTGFL